MYRLFESIRLENGHFQNLEGHAARIARSSREILGVDRGQELMDALKEAARPTDGLYKARLQYDAADETISYIPYQIKPVSSLKVVMDDRIDYSHKYTDRKRLEELHAQRGNCDEVIIVKNGFITDSSYSNLLFLSGEKWVTPKTCLLPGVMRQSLLSAQKIEEQQIHLSDLTTFTKIKLINAMVGMNGAEIDIHKIEM